MTASQYIEKSQQTWMGPYIALIYYYQHYAWYYNKHYQPFINKSNMTRKANKYHIKFRVFFVVLIF